ncbi:hypothetical protein LSH36_356g06101, partial [Paralvinella palmiformis]
MFLTQTDCLQVRTYSSAKMSLWSYLYAEINRGYHLEHEEEKFTEKRKRVQMFIRIPLEL